jgi:hypothetical protein
LFGVKWKYDPNLSVQKIYAHYAQASEFEQARNYIECLQEAHSILLNQYIYNGYKFARMEDNPLMSRDPMFGVPPLFVMIFTNVHEQRETQDE